MVAKARSLADVLRALGLARTGGNHRHIKRWIEYAGLDTSHFGGGSLIRALSKEQLELLVREALSLAAVLRALGLPEAGRPASELKRRLAVLGIDTSHFRGSAWSRGETRATHPAVERYAQQLALPDAEVFTVTSTIGGASLKNRLLRKGWQYVCAICGIAEWQGVALSLHVDHVNGLHYDNRLENLRFLCPNCHSQTPTYCRRRR